MFKTRASQTHYSGWSVSTANRMFLVLVSLSNRAFKIPTSVTSSEVDHELVQKHNWWGSRMGHDIMPGNVKSNLQAGSYHWCGLEKLSLNEKTLGKWSMPGSSPARLACWHIFGNFGPPAMYESLVVGYAISCQFMSLSLHNNCSFTQQADVSKLKFSICYISLLPLVMFQAHKSWRLNRSVSSTLCCDIFLSNYDCLSPFSGLIYKWHSLILEF